MNKDIIRKEYEVLKSDIIRYDEAYYDKNDSIISDYEYDMLRKKLEKMEEENPWLGNMGVNKIGHKSSQDRFPKVKHKRRMTSLKNTYNMDELFSFIKNICNDYNISDFIFQPKFDGLSLSLIYENGILVQAITRGNGEIGEDVTDNVRHIKSIPQVFKGNEDDPRSGINFNNLQGRLEVRGEILMSFEEFNKINNEREKLGLPLYANPRNLASGTLRNLDSSILDERELIFIAYEVYHDKLDDFKYADKFIQLCYNGFNRFCNDLYWPMNFISKDMITQQLLEFNFKEMLKVLTTSNTKLKLIRYKENSDEEDALDVTIPIDGIVIKCNVNSNDANKIGFTGERYPKFAVAYKFEPESVETTLRDVIFQVGRTGKVTPVAIMDPVYIDGSTVSKCTLHNFNEIISLGLTKNCTVKICKAAAIIPQIIERSNVINKGELPIEIPDKCPICGEPLKHHMNIDGSVTADIFCDNRGCSGRLLTGMLYHINILGIKGVGTEIAKIIIDIYKANMNNDKLQNCKGKISEFLIYPTFNLLYEEIVYAIGYKTASKILESIRLNVNGNTSLWRQIASLGISTIGESTSKNIARNYIGFGKLYDDIVRYKTLVSMLKEDDRIKLTNTLTEQNIDCIYDELINTSMSDNIRDFIFAHTTMDFVSREESFIEINTNGRFSGKSIIVTGTFDGMKREDVEKYVIKEGGRIVSGVSKNTDIVLVGDNPGKNKIDKANKLGIKLIYKNELNI